MKKKVLPLVLLSAFLLSCALSSNSSDSISSESISSQEASSSSQEESQSSSSLSSSSLPEIDYVKIFVPTRYTHVWAWTRVDTKETNLFPSWPGDALSSYDANWNTYDFEGYSSIWLVLSENGQNQTGDLQILSPGYHYYYNYDWYDEDPLSKSSSSEEESSYSSSSYDGDSSKGLDNRHRTWYQMLVYSFADGDNDGIGDFKGIVDHLDYLDALGIGGIWLSPIHKADSYHGYDVQDYYSINSEYEVGGVTFAKLLEECHKRDIKVILDMVLNHTSRNNAWFSQHPSWYSGETTFDYSMPDLNYDNSEVREAIKKVGQYWLNKGVDGFRCDGAAWIYGGSGWTINESDFSKTRAWWKEFSSAMRQIKSDAYIVGEVWTELQYVEQFYETKMSAFNFSASYWAKDAINNKNASTWVNEAVGHQSRVRQKDSSGVEASFLSNHDTGRFASLGFNEEQLKFANALNVMSPGGSFVYYGDELGMTGNKGSGWDDMGYRTPMPFSKGKTNPGSYMGNSSASSYTKSNKTADADAKSSSSIFAYTSKCIAAKNKYPSLYNAAASRVGGNSDSVCALRLGEYLLLINANDSSSEVSVSSSFDLLEDLSTNGSISINGSKLTMPKLSLALLSTNGSIA